MEDDFRVAAWLVEPRLNAVSRNGVTVHLEPKVMEVLVCLAQHAGEPVPKEKLLQAIWPDTFVTDDVLKRSIVELRRVFEDHARESRIIQTIPKRGYRLIARVGSANGAQVTWPGPRSPESRRPSRAWLLISGMCTTLFIIGLTALNESALREWLARRNVSQIRSVAVLPLENLSGDPNQEYFSDGITDVLINDLAQIGSLKVISRTSSMQYKETKKSLPEIARELNVDAIVEGTVQRSGNRVRITAQLVEASSDKHVWANSYELEIRDIFTLERDVTDEISQQVRARLATPGSAPPQQARPVDPSVLEAYLQGSYYLNRYGRGYGDEAQKKASDYFEQTIAADASFAPAYVGLFTAHVGLMWPSKHDGEIALEAAKRAVELGPDSSDARVVSGDLKFDHDWDFRRAEEEYRRAIALSPNNANAHDRLCNFLFDMGRKLEGMKECQIAQELDPTQNHLTDALFSAGEHDRAIAVAQMMLRSDPDNGWLHGALYHNYAMKGMYKEAGSEAEKIMALFGYPDRAARIHRASASPDSRAAIRQLAVEIEDLMKKEQVYIPIFQATNYAYLGDRDRALYWLEDMFKSHDRDWVGIGGPQDINSDPAFAPIRSDPRFKDLLRRVGLPQ